MIEDNSFRIETNLYQKELPEKTDMTEIIEIKGSQIKAKKELVFLNNQIIEEKLRLILKTN